MTVKPLLLPMLIAALAGCAAAPDKAEPPAAQAPAPTVKFGSPDQQAGYRLGLLHLQSLRDGSFAVDRLAYEQGLRDALAGASAETIGPADWQALAELAHAQSAAANLAVGHAFLEANKAKPGVVALPSGVQYQVLTAGKGGKPDIDDSVGILYRIAGIDGGVKLDNTAKGQAKMYEIPLQKILSPGWREALLLMPKGSKWRLFIPGELAFGDKGLSEKNILPNETLVIDVYLLTIKKAS